MENSMLIYRICLLFTCAVIWIDTLLPPESSAGDPESVSLRIALFNIKELSTEKLLDIDNKGKGKNEQLLAAAQIIRLTDPDILIINELDHDYRVLDQGLELNARRFQAGYLDQGKEAAASFPYIFTAACNTGILSGVDLNNDGITASASDTGSRNYGDDCYGFGSYPGQYAMAVFSKFPIDSGNVKTFQKFLWKDLPGQHMPPDYYSAQAIRIFRLSSKSHWDLPVLIGGKTVHLLLSHPTPTVFDGKEDRNGRRNFDEIKFWVDYLAGDSAIYDDRGEPAGFDNRNLFIIAGDLNTSPQSESRYDGMTAIDQLLHHPRISDTGAWLTSRGGGEGGQAGEPGYPERHTAQFGRGLKMQIDYILVSREIKVKTGGVYWPSAAEDPAAAALAEKASDHRMVWLDISLN
jgi:3-phytase